MLRSVETDCSWDDFVQVLRGSEDDTPPAFAGRLVEVDADGARPAAKVLLHVLTSRDASTLSFEYPEGQRLAAAQALLEWNHPSGLYEVTEYLRDHWFYDGETEEITALVEKMQSVRARPYRGLDGVELAQAIQERLFGHRSEPDEPVDRAELQKIRLVIWAVKDHVPFVLPEDFSTLQDLAVEIQPLGV